MTTSNETGVQGAQPVASAQVAPAAGLDPQRFVRHALKLADRLPDSEIAYTLRLHLNGAAAEPVKPQEPAAPVGYFWFDAAEATEPSDGELRHVADTAEQAAIYASKSQLLTPLYAAAQGEHWCKHCLGAFPERCKEIDTSLAATQADPVRPDLLERLTYHQHERDDMTLDEVLMVLAEGWKRVHGRTERQMLLQFLALMAGAPAPAEPNNLQRRAQDLVEKASMPWREAEALALSEVGVTSAVLDELIGEHGPTGLDSVLVTPKDLREFARSLLVWSPLNCPDFNRQVMAQRDWLADAMDDHR